MNWSSLHRVLLVRLSALGDIVHALPAFHLLREKLPHAHLAWLVEDRFATVLDGLEGLDERILVPRRRAAKAPDLQSKRRAYQALIRQLRTRRFDVAFDLQGLFKSSIWLALSGARYRIGYGDRAAREFSWLAYNHKIVPKPGVEHIVERHISLVGSFLGCAMRPVPACGLPVYADVRARVLAWLQTQERHGPLVMLSPGAGWPTKRWPTALFARLASMLAEQGCDVLVLWGPGEEELADEIRVGSLSERVKLVPPTTVHEMTELLRHASLLVAGDTGPLHLAAAVGTATVGIYGPSECKRNGPYGSNHRTVRNEALECLECWKHHCDTPSDTACMTELPIEAVYQTCIDQIQSTVH